MLARSVLVIAVGVGVVGCAAAGGGPAVQYETGKRAAVTGDGLHRVKVRRIKAAYVRPGANFVGYRKLVIAPVAIYTKRESARGGRKDLALSPIEMERFRRIFQEALEEELGASQSFTLVDEPAPDALLVRGLVVDLVVNTPREQGGSKVYSLSGGDMTVLLDVADSQSGVSIARLADRKRIGSGGTMMSADLHPYAATVGIGTGAAHGADVQWTAARRIFRSRARLLREGLEELIVLGPIPETGYDR